MKYFLNIFFLIILNLFCSEVVSQKITIVDSTSGRPIRAVLVFDSEKINRTVSNRNGTVYLNSFKDSDTIIFTHMVSCVAFFNVTLLSIKNPFLS